MLRHHSFIEKNFWLTKATWITAAAVILFEVIPMSSIFTDNLIIRHQQEEHIIYLTTALINTKPKDEHVIAIPSYGLFLLSHLKNGENTKTKKLLHRTFRIAEDVIKALENEASAKGIPLSNIVNNILRTYLSAQLHSGFVLASKDFFRTLFAKINEEYIEGYGTELSFVIVSEYTSSFFPEINSYTLLQFLGSWFKRFDSYQHRIDEENNRHSYSVNHDINKNFSIVLKVILERLIEPITKSKLIFAEISSSSITFTFEI